MRDLTTWAVIATGKHLFPFRTEKLSPLAPMVLEAQAPGRVGRRPFLQGPARGPFSCRAQPLAPLGVELPEALDAFAELRVRVEERSEPLLGEGVHRVERL